MFKDKDPQKAVCFSTGGGSEFGAILNKKPDLGSWSLTGC